MKKMLLLAIMAIASLFSANAQTVIANDYSSPITGADGQNVNSDDDNESVSFVGLGYFSCNDWENYSISFMNYTFNGVCAGVNLRSNLEFSEHQGTFNADVLINYSYGVYRNSDVKVMITGEAGPSLASRSYIDSDGDISDGFFIDALIGIKGTVIFNNKVVLSAGYQIWAPKFKFGKDYNADGFYAQLGIHF